MSSVPVYQWQPTTDEIAERAGITPERVVRFDQNTSPFAPPWVTSEATRAAATSNEYPRADYRPLRRALAEYHGIDDERRIVVGAGADEIILLVAKTYLGPGTRAVTERPSYAMYRIATLQTGAELTEIARRLPDLAFPAAELAAAAPGAEVVWLCVPHNPVGDVPASAELQPVLSAARGVVVIDAAYAEFSPGAWEQVLDLDGEVIAAGTMSKAFGLAGIRVGYAVTTLEQAARLEAMRPPGSISTVSAALALRGLEDPGWMLDNVERIIAGRAELATRLAGLGWAVRPTATNFVLAAVGADAHRITSEMMDRFGLVIRSFPAGHLLDDHLRFTVRTPEDHDRLLEALEQTL